MDSRQLEMETWEAKKYWQRTVADYSENFVVWWETADRQTTYNVLQARG